MSLVRPPRGYSIETALIGMHGPDTAPRESGFFDSYVTAADMLGK